MKTKSWVRIFSVIRDRRYRVTGPSDHGVIVIGSGLQSPDEPMVGSPDPVQNAPSCVKLKPGRVTPSAALATFTFTPGASGALMAAGRSTAYCVNTSLYTLVTRWSWPVASWRHTCPSLMFFTATKCFPDSQSTHPSGSPSIAARLPSVDKAAACLRLCYHEPRFRRSDVPWKYAASTESQRTTGRRSAKARRPSQGRSHASRCRSRPTRCREGTESRNEDRNKDRNFEKEIRSRLRSSSARTGASDYRRP